MNREQRRAAAKQQNKKYKGYLKRNGLGAQVRRIELKPALKRGIVWHLVVYALKFKKWLSRGK